MIVAVVGPGADDVAQVATIAFIAVQLLALGFRQLLVAEVGSGDCTVLALCGGVRDLVETQLGCQ